MSKPKRWKSWRVCPACGSRATKILYLSEDPPIKCQICEHRYYPPATQEPTAGERGE